MSDEITTFNCRIPTSTVYLVAEFLEGLPKDKHGATVFQRVVPKHPDGRRAFNRRAPLLAELAAGFTADPGVAVAACEAAEAKGITLREWLADAVAAGVRARFDSDPRGREVR